MDFYGSTKPFNLNPFSFEYYSFHLFVSRHYQLNKKHLNVLHLVKRLFPLRIELRTFRVLSGCDNHYTMETLKFWLLV